MVELELMELDELEDMEELDICNIFHLLNGCIILDKTVQNFRWVNFQFGFKINTTYPGEHSDITSLEL